MNQNELFTVALGLTDLWRVEKSELKDVAGGKKVLELDLGFERGTKFPCSKCGALCGIHDTVVRKWRHLQFWQHETVIHARVPRTDCETDGVLQVSVPWARAESGFTLFFESIVMLLAKEMAVSAVARYLNEHDGRIWRIIHHYVDKAHGKQDWREVDTIAVDETSTRKGHKYATVVVDVDRQKKRPARLLFMTPGKTAESLAGFVAEMPKHNAVAEQISLIAMDMGRAYQKGAAEHLPLADISFDRYHVMLGAGKAVDQVRRDLKEAGSDMRGAMWALRGNPKNLSETNKNLREKLCAEYKEIGRALALREMLAQTWDNFTIRLTAEEHLRQWCSWASRSRLKPFKELAKTIQTHWDGILGFFPSRLTSASIEAINGIIQGARRRARGYRNFKNLSAICYWMAGNLNLELPTINPR